MKRAIGCVVSMCCLSLMGGGALAAQPDLVQCRQGLTLIELQPLDFGGFVANGTGTVTIDPASGARSSTGLIVLGAAGGNAGQRGIFEVSVTVAPGVDCTPYPIGITLPNNVTLSDAVGNTLTINAWTSSPTDGNIYVGAGNAPAQVYVGATANVTAGQVGGLYTGTYTVRMQY